MEKIKVNVSGTVITAENVPILTSGMVGLEIAFTFDSQWDNLRKTVVFQAGGKTIDRIDVTSETTVPWEIMRREGSTLTVGVYGINEEGTLVIPTLWIQLGEIQPGADPSGDESADATLPVWEQVREEMETAVEEKLAEAKESGLFDGAQGEKGEPGKDGKDGETPDVSNKADSLIDTKSGSFVTINADYNTPVILEITLEPDQIAGTPTPTNICYIYGHEQVAIDICNDSVCETVSVSLPYNASFGGVIDWETGKYTQTYGYIAFDGTESWAMAGSRPGVFILTEDSFKGGQEIYHKCSHYNPVKNSSYSIATIPDKASKGLSSGGRFYVCDLDFTTLEDFKDYLVTQHANGTPVQFVYKLRTPIEHDLGALESLIAKGTQTQISFSNSSGKTVEVTYHANAMALINELRAAIVALGGTI